MRKIKVSKISKDKFKVEINENEKSQYKVTLDSGYYQKLTNRRISKEKLIEKSFEFLLKREPKESILSSFNLRLINKYFPEFEQEIKMR